MVSDRVRRELALVAVAADPPVKAAKWVNEHLFVVYVERDGGRWHNYALSVFRTLREHGVDDDVAVVVRDHEHDGVVGRFALRGPGSSPQGLDQR